jgi:hypothetical protein
MEINARKQQGNIAAARRIQERTNYRCFAGCRDFTVRLAKEVIMLMFVGTDTTSYTISRSLVWLSKYPEWLKALNDEQDRLVPEHGAELSREVCAPLATTF